MYLYVTMSICHCVDQTLLNYVIIIITIVEWQSLVESNKTTYQHLNIELNITIEINNTIDKILRCTALRR